jgi:hypothetical protein
MHALQSSKVLVPEVPIDKASYIIKNKLVSPLTGKIKREIRGAVKRTITRYWVLMRVHVFSLAADISNRGHRTHALLQYSVKIKTQSS